MRMRWGGACGAYGGGKNVYRILIAKSEGNRSPGRARRRWRIILKLILKN
jgi:hypothetical protein